MATKIINGSQIQLFYQGKTFAYAQSHTLSMTGNTTDSTNKDTGVFGSNEVTSITWEVTCDYLYTEYDYDELFDLMMYRRPIMIEVAEVRNYSENGLVSTGGDTVAWIPSTITRRGYAVITSLNTTANNSESASYSITLTGSGPLTIVDNTTTNYYIDVTYEDDIEGMPLFNTQALNYVNSGWVYSGNSSASRPQMTQIDISDGKLHDATPNENPVFRYYLSGPAIPEHMFDNFTTLSEVFISQNIYEISEYAFAHSSIERVTSANQSMRYKHHCFNDCIALNDINKSNNVNYLKARYIANDAFIQCVNLGVINVGDGCQYILANAFSDCVSLSTVYFGDSLTRIGDNAFVMTQHTLPKEFHFYTETAPTLGTLPFGPVGYQTIILHNSLSVEYFVESNASWHQYENADIQLAV